MSGNRVERIYKRYTVNFMAKLSNTLDATDSCASLGRDIMVEFDDERSRKIARKAIEDACHEVLSKILFEFDEQTVPKRTKVEFINLLLRLEEGQGDEVQKQ